MRRDLLLLFLVCCLCPIAVVAQVRQSISTQTAVTNDGRIVVLKSDGRWEYPSEVETAARRKQGAERKSLLEVETDQAAFLERPFILNGTLEMSALYLVGYQNAQQTHYAFMFREQPQSARAAFLFMQRGEAAATLRKRMLDHNGRLDGLFTVVILKERSQRLTDYVYAELIDYTLPDAPASRAGTATPRSTQETNVAPKPETREYHPANAESRTISTSALYSSGEALDALKKIDVTFSLGVNFRDYVVLVRDAKLTVDQALVVLPEGELKTTMTDTMNDYLFGVRVCDPRYGEYFSAKTDDGKLLVQKYGVVPDKGMFGARNIDRVVACRAVISAAHRRLGVAITSFNMLSKPQ